MLTNSLKTYVGNQEINKCYLGNQLVTQTSKYVPLVFEGSQFSGFNVTFSDIITPPSPDRLIIVAVSAQGREPLPSTAVINGILVYSVDNSPFITRANSAIYIVKGLTGTDINFQFLSSDFTNYGSNISLYTATTSEDLSTILTKITVYNSISPPVITNEQEPYSLIATLSTDNTSGQLLVSNPSLQVQSTQYISNGSDCQQVYSINNIIGTPEILAVATSYLMITLSVKS